MGITSQSLQTAIKTSLINIDDRLEKKAINTVFEAAHWFARSNHTDPLCNLHFPLYRSGGSLKRIRFGYFPRIVGKMQGVVAKSAALRGSLVSTNKHTLLDADQYADGATRLFLQSNSHQGIRHEEHTKEIPTKHSAYDFHVHSF